MQLQCPHCQRTVQYADERPRFCGFCGRELGTSVDQASAHALPLAPLRSGSAAEDTRPSSPRDLAVTQSFHSSGPPAEAGSVPERLGGYRLVRELGRGGMGVVYEAQHEDSGRRVAIKLLPARVHHSDAAAQRFLREGRIAASLFHPRSTFIFAAGEDQDRFYIVMELMTGGTVRDLIERSGRLPVTRAVDYILDVIDGLEAAHSVGVIHRDVKPSNCFLDAGGRVKIGDYGLSKSLVADAELTRTGAFMGTPLFAAPEQIKGGQVDARTDLYAVGATLFYLLTGQPPFRGDAARVIAEIASEPAPRLRQLLPEVSPELDQLIAQTLEKDPARRPVNLSELRAALLPFSSRGVTIADAGRRLAAFFVDMTAAGILSTLVVALVSLASLASRLEPQSVGLVAGTTSWLVWMLYFFIAEGFWGRGLGKWLAGLRVVTRQGTRAGWLKILIRALLVPGLIGVTMQVLPASAVDLSDWTDPSQSLNHRILTLAVGRVVPLMGWVVGLLILLPARRRNGYRGLHEWLSGTRVARVYRTDRPAAAEPPVLAAEAVNAPVPFGPYAATGRLTAVQPSGRSVRNPAIGGGEPVSVWQARDNSLGRVVWIVQRPAEAQPFSSARMSVARPARLHWLDRGSTVAASELSQPSGDVSPRSHATRSQDSTSSSLATADTRPADADTVPDEGRVGAAAGKPSPSTPAGRWDALEAVRGAPLHELLRQNWNIPWPELCRMLRELTEELLAATGDDTLPATLDDSQVWVDRSYRIRLLDFPLAPNTATENTATETTATANLVRDAAPVLSPASYDRHPEPTGTSNALPERESPSPEESWSKVGGLLQRLIQAVLATQHVPGEAEDLLRDFLQTPPSREALEGLLTDLDPTSDRDGKIGWDMRFAVMAISLSIESTCFYSLIFIAALVLRFAWGLSALPTFGLLVLLAATAVWGSCYGAIGGPAFRMVGILVRRNGRPISRWRSAIRGWLAWMPALVSYSLLMTWVTQALVGLPEADTVVNPTSTGVQAVALLAYLGIGLPLMLLHVAGAVFAVVHPRRGLQDYFSGTYLVPK